MPGPRTAASIVGSHPWWGRQARWSAVALGTVSVGVALAGMPRVWVLLAPLSLAVFISMVTGRRLMSVVPLAFVCVLAAVAVLSLTAGWAGLAPLHTRRGGVAVLGSATALALLATAVLTRSVPRTPTRRPARVGPESIRLLPFAVMVVLGAVIQADPSGDRLRWFLSGDHLRHLAMVTRLVDSGALEYESQTYPRGWHALIGAMWSSTGPDRAPEGLDRLIMIHAHAAWLVVALLILSVSELGFRLARARGHGLGASGAAGCLAGLVIMGPQVAGDHVTRGFETSTLAAAVLVIVVVELTTVRPSPTALVAAGLGVFLVAHTWQVLLPTAAVLLVIALAREVKSPRRREGTAVRVVFALCAAALGLPSVLAALSAYGVGAVGLPGEAPAPLLWWALCASGAAWWVNRGNPSLRTQLIAVGVTVATALLMACASRVPLAAYYPSKVIWVGVVLGVPSVAVLIVSVLRWLDRRGRVGSTVFVVGGTLAGLAGVLFALTPVMGVFGSWGGADARWVLGVARSAQAPDIALVWQARSPVDDATAQLLLDFYSATATTPPLQLAPTTVEDQCAALASRADPLVLTDALDAELRERFACVDGIRSVRPGEVP